MSKVLGFCVMWFGTLAGLGVYAVLVGIALTALGFVTVLLAYAAGLVLRPFLPTEIIHAEEFSNGARIVIIREFNDVTEPFTLDFLVYTPHDSTWKWHYLAHEARRGRVRLAPGMQGSTVEIFLDGKKTATYDWIEDKYEYKGLQRQGKHLSEVSRSHGKAKLLEMLSEVEHGLSMQNTG